MESLGECAAGELGGDPVGEGALPLHSRDVPGPQVEGENHASLTEPGDRVESLASHRRSFDCRLVPPVESGSETFASKALRELLRPANLPLPLGELRVRGDALVSVLHPSVEHRRLDAARESHDGARECHARAAAVGCFVQPLVETLEHGPLRHPREGGGQPAPVHAGGLPLLDPSSERAFHAPVRDRQHASLNLNRLGVPVTLLLNLGAPVRKRDDEHPLRHSHRRASQDGAPALVALHRLCPHTERGEGHAAGHAHERGLKPAALHLVRLGVVSPPDKRKGDVPLHPGQRDAAGELVVHLQALVRIPLRLLPVLDDAEPVVKGCLLRPTHKPGEDVGDHLALPPHVFRSRRPRVESQENPALRDPHDDRLNLTPLNTERSRVGVPRVESRETSALRYPNDASLNLTPLNTERSRVVVPSVERRETPALRHSHHARAHLTPLDDEVACVIVPANKSVAERPLEPDQDEPLSLLHARSPVASLLLLVQPLRLELIGPLVERGRFTSLQHAHEAEPNQGSLTLGTLHRGGPRIERLERPPLLHPRYAGSDPVPVNLGDLPVDAPLHERGVDRLVLDRQQETLGAGNLSLPLASRPLSLLRRVSRFGHSVYPVHEP